MNGGMEKTCAIMTDGKETHSALSDNCLEKVLALMDRRLMFFISLLIMNITNKKILRKSSKNNKIIKIMVAGIIQGERKNDRNNNSKDYPLD